MAYTPASLTNGVDGPVLLLKVYYEREANNIAGEEMRKLIRDEITKQFLSDPDFHAKVMKIVGDRIVKFFEASDSTEPRNRL